MTLAGGASSAFPSSPPSGGRLDLTSESWRKVRDVLAEVLKHPGRERATHVERLCGDDHELRRLVASYLQIDPRIDAFFERGARPPEPGEPGPDELTTTEDPKSADGVAAGAAAGSLVGRRVGPYKVERLLSKGGMGAVYLAEREGDFEKRVALKVIRRGKATGETVRWFHNERQILARLEHPNIARLLDGGTTEEGLPYLVMEYIDGQPIDVYCDQERLTLGQRLELFLKVCRAVHHAHQKLVVHCDLKPGNVLITADRVPKIVDFGIARLLRPELAEKPSFYDVATALHTGPLTPDYASPEQLLGFRMSTVSDVYSLGVVLYLLLTGHLPYNIRRHEHMERLIFRERPRLPSGAVFRSAALETAGGEVCVTPETVSRARRTTPRSLSRRIAGDLDHIVLRAMSRDPDRRYGSAAELAEDLRRHLEHQPVTARKQTLAYRAGRFIRRNRLAALVLSLLLAFAVSSTVLWQRAASERRQAAQVLATLENLLRLFGPDESKGLTVDKREGLDRGHQELAELPADSESRAILAGVLGRGYRGLDGEEHRALELLEQSVDIQRRLSSHDKLRLVQTIDDLGELLYDLGRPAEAVARFREALALEHELSAGYETSDSLQIRNNLASSLVMLGEYEEAEPLFRKVRDGKRRLLAEAEARRDPGETDRLVESLVVTGNNLAHVLAEQSRYQEAVELYREGLRRRIELHGVEDLSAAGSFNSLGITRYAQDERLDEAEEMLRKALDIRREAWGEEHPAVATSLNNLGLLLLELGKLDEAEDHVRAALAIRRRDRPGTQKVAVSERTLAALLVARGRPAEAEPLARRALATFRDRLPPGHWRIADAESILGHCLAELGAHHEAEPLLLAGYRGLLESRGENTIYTRQARQRLREFLPE